ncbi:MAG: hypothetical protein EOO74_02825 [Myxococcales bacterium]|nr:MAG: hypothetical protein EOO74_02825 [Myxococcales bacterium]
MATVRMIYVAPCCGCVWSKVPADDDPPDALSLKDINASQVELPTPADLLQERPPVAILRTERLSSWRDDIPLAER